VAEDLPAQPSILIDFGVSPRPVGCVLEMTFANSPGEIEAGTLHQVRLFLDPDKADLLALALRAP